MVKVSIIIPVFNVEDYLNECLDSVLNQTFTDFEVICINDGSTDDSLDILHSYAKMDSRLRVYSQENRGPGAARNVGLRMAVGDYIYFLDSDDYIYPDSIQEMYESAVLNNSDIVMIRMTRTEGIDRVKNDCGYNLDDIFNIPNGKYKEFSFSNMDIKKHIVMTYYTPAMHLYRREFLESWDDLYYPEGIVYEDILFHVKTFIRAERFSHVPKVMTYYRNTPKSIMNNSKYNMQIFNAIDVVEEFLIKTGYYDQLKNEVDFFKIKQILMYIISVHSTDYFKTAKERFFKIRLSKNHIINPVRLHLFNMVLESESYWDFLKKYYAYQLTINKSEFKDIKQQYKKVNRKNKKLKKRNNSLKNSSSWKITKPLRSFRNFFKR